jgi:SAM-dependent methyltransferase
MQSGTIDLIMVAQALHWFDLNRFYAEARRVLKPSGALAASAYNLLQIEPAIDELVSRYYYEVVGPFWPPERALVEHFADLPFPFHKIDPPKFEVTAHWNLDHLIGYLGTWSATQRFISARGGDPLKEMTDELRIVWGDPQQTRRVIWPLILRIGVKTTAEAPKRVKKRRTPRRPT